MTAEQIAILSHALGIVHYTQVAYRNNFCSYPGDGADRKNVEALVHCGMMAFPGVARLENAVHFEVTPSGERLVREVMKPEGNLYGWWTPEGARAAHYVDLQATLPSGYNRYPQSKCGRYRYEPSYPELATKRPERVCKFCSRAAAV